MISDQQLEMISVQLNMVKDIAVNYGYYKDIYQHLDELNNYEKFMIVVCNNCLSMAFTTWCKLFGKQKNNHYHIKNVAKETEIDINQFYSLINSKYGFNDDSFSVYAEEILAFRDKYFSHTDRSFELAVPNIEKACLIAIDYFNWVSELLYYKYAIKNDIGLREVLYSYFVEIYDLLKKGS